MADRRTGGRDHPEDVLFGRRPVLELLRTGRSVDKIYLARDLAPSSVLGEIRRRAEEATVPIRMVPKEQIDRLAGGGNHQGVAAVAGRFRYTPIEQLLEIDAVALVFLDGLTDPHNLGSLLRTADSAGFHGVVIPAHRSVQVTSAVRRVSAGASEVVPVARVKNLVQAIEQAKQADVWILGLDEKTDKDVWTSDLMSPPVGLVLGAEDRGISKNVREHCDELVRIPHTGRIGSLNVAVAGAVAMFEVARRLTLSANL